MAHTGLLFISNVTKVQRLFSRASKCVNKVLYISINGATENVYPSLSKQIVNIYTMATAQNGNLDVRLILKPTPSVEKIKTTYPIELIMFDNSLQKDIKQLKNLVSNLKSSCKLQNMDDNDDDLDMTNLPPVKKYEYVAVGGTFDRLHNGHKILLSQALIRTTKQLTVGVTDVNMIQQKKLWELIQPVDERIESVLKFLTDINPDIDYNVVPIQDIYGPTKDDPKLQLLVLSEETVKGGVKVNEMRQQNCLKPMDTYCIELAEEAKLSVEEESKVSSSNRRMRLLGTTIRPPIPNPNIPDWPYVLGLAGGIASGKSKIAEKLQAKGAAIINCDIIAHELYKPGLPMNATLATTFGKDIVMETGEIDRKKLGHIVFTNKDNLHKLNSIIWPAIIEETQSRITELRKEGYKVVVMEAAVLIKAGWDKYCHQLWAVIIPEHEAVKRLQVRNNLSEIDAKERIAAQIPNIEQVKKANVVFSPYWSFDYTQSQVDKAWDDLQKYLQQKN